MERFILLAALAIQASAQPAAFMDHVQSAKLLAAEDLAGRNLVDCSMPPQSAAPTGQPIVARFSVKPTSSILTPRKTIDVHGKDTEIATKGRHDPCVGIRAVPIGEAMVACVLADHAMRHLAQTGSVYGKGELR